MAPDKLNFANGRVFFESRGLTFAQAAGLAEEKFGTLGAVGSYKPPRAPGRYKGAGVGPSPAYSYTACVVEAEVDPATGWITVPKIWIAHDIGRAINPVLARGQVEGSVYMGLSEALMEEQVFRRLPPEALRRARAQDTVAPRIQEPHVARYARGRHRAGRGSGPELPVRRQGSRAGTLLPVMPAVANAIYDAVGVRIDELPITPDKV